MGEVSRVLKPNGTFWVAIGDEYAAEFKLILAKRFEVDLPQLSHLVLHVRRKLQVQIHAVACSSVLLCKGSGEPYV